MASEMTGKAGVPGDEEAQEESQDDGRDAVQDEGQEEARLLAELDALVEMHGVNRTGVLLGVHASSVSRWSTRRLATTKLASVLGAYTTRREFEQCPAFEVEGEARLTPDELAEGRPDERADERWESFEERLREVEERRVLSPDDLGGLRLRSWRSAND